MSYFLAPIGDCRAQFFDSQGNVLAGGFLYAYAATSTTPTDTYTDSTGGSKNQNPIQLDSAGRTPSGVYLTAGVSYKFVLTDSAGVTIWTQDVVGGINDVASQVQDEWVASGLTPTYVSATSFTLAGDQTTEFHIGRRLKSTNSGGTIYSTITNSVFGALTTVTVVNDSGTLDSGLSAVSYGILRSTNASVPWLKGSVNLAGRISPSQITANQNDYNPSSLATANMLRISSDARRSLTGLSGGSDGRIMSVFNVGTFPILLKYEDTNSTAANRFSFACTLGGGQTMMIQYDSVSARWRPIYIPEPIGTLKDFGTSTMPEGFLAIDQNVSRTTYAALFNEIGTTWGTGDGSTTFGLYVGAGRTLIAAGTGTVSEGVAAADVDTTADTFAVVSNNTKWITGMAVVLTTTGGLPTGLSLATTYYVIRSSATLIKFATSLANAQNGTAINLTTQGTGTHTLTCTLTARTHGEVGGEEAHAESSTEQLAHVHPIAYNGTLNGGGAGANVIDVGSSTNTGSTGGNAAMNVMNPFAVVTRGIRYV